MCPGKVVGSGGLEFEFEDERMRSGSAGTANRGSDDFLFFTSLGIEVCVKGSTGQGVSSSETLSDKVLQINRRTHR